MNLSRIASSLVLGFCLAVVLPSVVPAHPQRAAAPDFAAVDAYVEAQMKENRIPGMALAIVQGDQIVYLKGYGVADPSGRPVTPQTPFALASLVKPMTALAVMQLVEQGQLELDAPVQRYLPWFRVADEAASAEITIRQLLYHTSGIPGTAGLEYAGEQDLRPDAIERRVRGLQSVQLTHPLGETYEYSNPNYQILGMVIQQVTGQAYEAYMQEQVFQPLEMGRTFTSKSEAQRNGVATGYRAWYGLRVPWDAPFDRAGLPSGFMFASVEDMAHFLIPHINEGRFGDAALVSPAGMAELLRPAGMKVGGQEEYAMDWGVTTLDGEPVIVKGGDLSDAKTQMVLIPNGHGAVVTLMNTNDSLSATLGDLRIPFITIGVIQILLAKEVAPAPTNSMPVIYRAVPTLIVVLLLLGIVVSALALKRWRSTPARRPHGFLPMAWHVALPFIVYLGPGLIALLAVPRVFGIPLSFMRYMYPDFGYAIQDMGVIGVAWSLVWLALSVYVLRRAERGAPVPVAP